MTIDQAKANHAFLARSASSSSLGKGAIAGISAACGTVLIVMTGILTWYALKHRERKEAQRKDAEEARARERAAQQEAFDKPELAGEPIAMKRLSKGHEKSELDGSEPVTPNRERRNTLEHLRGGHHVDVFELPTERFD